MIYSKFTRFLLLNLIIFHEVQVLSFEKLFYQPPHTPKVNSSIIKFFETNNDSSSRIKIWVTFTDKNILNNDQFHLEKKYFASKLTEKSIERRLKVIPANKLIDHADLQVPSVYIEKVLDTGARHRTTSRWFNAISVIASKSQIEKIEKLKFVRKISKVGELTRNEIQEESMYLNLVSQAVHPVTDLDYGVSYDQVSQIHVLPLHQQEYYGNQVLVCIMDTGFRKDHEIFSDAIIMAERDFVDDDYNTQADPADPKDQSNKHGTMIWSVLGGFKSRQLIGPAYGANFLLAKTEDLRSEMPAEEDFWIEAAEWADSLGAQVISSSSGFSKEYTFENLDGNTISVTKAADRAVHLGIVVVTSCGNDRLTSWGHIVAPADGDSVISVGAVQADGILASFSSPGPTYDGRIKPEVCARGLYVACALSKHPSAYGYMSGTSLATPLVAGVAALLIEIHPEWTPLNVREALMVTASHSLCPNNDYGWGIPDAFKASQVNFSDFVLDTVTIDDDSIGESLGNGNWLIDSGEIVELTPVLTNRSNQPYQNLDAILENSERLIQIINNSIHPGNFAPGETKILNESFRIAIRDSLPMNTEIPFFLSLISEKKRFAKLYLSLRVNQATTYTFPIKGNKIKSDFYLYPNYPNPFNFQTVIRYFLGCADFVSLNIFDISGRRIRSLVINKQVAGIHESVWDGKDDAGFPVATGMYLCCLKTLSYQSVQKVLLLK